MKSLETLVVDHVLHEKLIEAVQGDLTELPAGHRYDVLVVSAFPGDYTPTDSSLIGALDRAGVSVAALARDRAHDLRASFSCWLSHPIDPDLGLGFERILCFEPGPGDRGPAAQVDDIFRALAPFIGLPEKPVTSVVMPLVTAGDRGTPVEDVVEPLIRAAVHWMRTSPLHRVAVFARSDPDAVTLEAEAKRLRQELIAEQAGGEKSYDVFLSYAHANSDAADLVVGTLRDLAPGIRVFRDTARLRPGHDYRVQLDEAVRSARRFVPLLTPEYVVSPACQDEFNAAWSIRERHDPDLFVPLFIASTELEDPRMGYVQYQDCTELDTGKIRAACEALANDLGLG